MKISKYLKFLELISEVDIDNPVMDFDEYGSKLFWFDEEGEYICHYNLENGVFGFSHDKIWSFFEKEYNLNYAEIQTFIKTMMEQHFKFKGITPLPSLSDRHERWNNISNSRV